jgi:hypothetical protein
MPQAGINGAISRISPLIPQPRKYPVISKARHQNFLNIKERKPAIRHQAQEGELYFINLTRREGIDSQAELSSVQDAVVK